MTEQQTENDATDAEGRGVPSEAAQAAHAAFHEAWGGPAQSLNLYVDSPIWERVAEAVVTALQGEQMWAVAHDDPTPYMNGTRTTRMREVGDYEQAEAMLEIVQARSEKAPRQNLHIETRWVTPWEVT